MKTPSTARSRVRRILPALMVVGLAIPLAACQTTGTTPVSGMAGGQILGGIGGAVGGAVLGSAATRNSGPNTRALGVVGGAIAGGLGGSAAGSLLDGPRSAPQYHQYQPPRPAWQPAPQIGNPYGSPSHGYSQPGYQPYDPYRRW